MSAARLAAKAKQVDDGVQHALALATHPAAKAHRERLASFDGAHAKLSLEHLVRGVRAGEIDLALTESSGWYDVLAWSFEPLLEPGDAHLDALFRGLLTAARDTIASSPDTSTHAPPTRTAVPLPAPSSPLRLTVEPLVTHYQRRADSYRYVRGALAAAFGDDALGSMYGVRHGQAVNQPLGMELAAMIHLFDGAAATAMRELGTPTTWSTTVFDRWRGGMGDPDVDADLRTMVPVAYDEARRVTRVWMLLGWEDGPLSTPVTAEAEVTRVLDHAAFRAVCDEHRTKEEILSALV